MTQSDEIKPLSFSTNFGNTVTGYLSDRNLSQRALARMTGKTPTHLNHVLTGRYSRPTAYWADIIANALDLTEEDSYRLHLAAAKDQGFKL